MRIIEAALYYLYLRAERTVMIEGTGGILAGVAAILTALAVFVPKWADAYIRVRTFHDSRNLRLLPDYGGEHEAITETLDAQQGPPEQGVPLAG
jgi:hypothetical protein